MNANIEIDWTKILYVDPKKIELGCSGLSFRLDNERTVQDGDWDKKTYKVERDSLVYKSIRAITVDGIKWENTPLYEWMIQNIETNNIIHQRGCNTKELVLKRGEEIYDLYQKIKKEGKIRSQSELTPRERINSGLMDEITVVIDRHGRIIFANNGIHRLCISKILGFKQIPVLVYRRHKEWEDFKIEVYNTCDSFWNKKAYQQLPHPDFYNIATEWDDTRYNIIKPLINAESKTILDIGSMFGYFCHKFEEDGYTCTAVESLERYLNILKKLKDASNMKFSIFSKSIFELKKMDYDVIFSFNVFHHFIKSEESHDKLIKLLNNLNYKEMYVQLHTPDEKQMIGAYKNYDNIEFVNFIINNSKNKSKFDFVAGVRGRNIYKIY